MSVLQYFKKTPGRPPIGRQAQSVIFFFKFATRSLEKKRGAVAPPQRATGACRPPLGRQGPVARWGGDRAFFSQGPHCEFEEKKLHLSPVALWEGDRGVFLKNISKRTYIFEIFIFKKYKKEKTASRDLIS